MKHEEPDVDAETPDATEAPDGPDVDAPEGSDDKE